MAFYYALIVILHLPFDVLQGDTNFFFAMSGKVSSSKGKKGSKKPAQKHQNTFAFQPSKFSAMAQKIAATPSHGICQKCVDILEWRKRMNKYKPLTQPKKCVECGSKTIKEAYHVICNACAETLEKCAKCLELKDIVSR
jgi:hypothetical protein